MTENDEPPHPTLHPQTLITHEHTHCPTLILQSNICGSYCNLTWGIVMILCDLATWLWGGHTEIHLWKPMEVWYNLSEARGWLFILLHGHIFPSLIKLNLKTRFILLKRNTMDLLNWVALSLNWNPSIQIMFKLHHVGGRSETNCQSEFSTVTMYETEFDP